MCAIIIQNINNNNNKHACEFYVSLGFKMIKLMSEH